MVEMIGIKETGVICIILAMAGLFLFSQYRFDSLQSFPSLYNSGNRSTVPQDSSQFSQMKNFATVAENAGFSLRQSHPGLAKATYRYIRPFLLATPQTVTSTQPPSFLTDVKNPCFAMDKNYINVGGISLATAIEMGYQIKCLPYVYLAGISKCGTSDLHANLIKHQLLYGILLSLKRSGHVGDTDYRSVKESHFWDNRHCSRNRTLERFTDRMSAVAIIESYQKYGDKTPYSPKHLDDYREMLYIESTPRQSWHHDSWNEERVHWGRSQPFEFTPDRIHHATPDAKVIFLVRDPVERSFSDYKFLTPRKPYHSAEDFHRKVVDAISWWRNCTNLYAERTCGYGNAPPSLPPHNCPSCGMKGYTQYLPPCKDYKSWGCYNAVDRFRISFYYLYLAEWLRVFPRKNILILRTEDMMVNRLGVLDRIFDFLKLPPIRTNIREVIAKNSGRNNRSKSHIEMLNQTRAVLEQFFEPMKQKLAKLLGETKPLW